MQQFRLVKSVEIARQQGLIKQRKHAATRVEMTGTIHVSGMGKSSFELYSLLMCPSLPLPALAWLASEHPSPTWASATPLVKLFKLQGMEPLIAGGQKAPPQPPPKCHRQERIVWSTLGGFFLPWYSWCGPLLERGHQSGWNFAALVYPT